jgi:hypothetical protein
VQGQPTIQSFPKALEVPRVARLVTHLQLFRASISLTECQNNKKVLFLREIFRS